MLYLGGFDRVGFALDVDVDWCGWVETNSAGKKFDSRLARERIGEGELGGGDVMDDFVDGILGDDLVDDYEVLLRLSIEAADGLTTFRTRPMSILIET